MNINRNFIKKRLILSLKDRGYIVLRPLTLSPHPFVIAEKNSRRCLMSIFYKKSIPFEKIKLIRKVADSKRIQADVVAIFVVTDQSKEVLRVAKANNVKIINIKDFDKRTLP